jgi:SAM-dependent methyltransferase
MPPPSPPDGEPAFDVGPTYDRVARKYAAAFFDELARKPFDRALLDRFAADVRPLGLVCDVGCGPGHVARALRERGVDMCGLDLSPAMVAISSELNPAIPFAQGDMLHLPVADAAWGGIVCFYTLIHLTRTGVPLALAEFHRALRPGGRLLLAVHGGRGTVHTENWFGEPVAVDATLFTTDELALALRAAGFIVTETLERPPYDFEYQSQRLYLCATKPEERADQS